MSDIDIEPSLTELTLEPTQSTILIEVQQTPSITLNVDGEAVIIDLTYPASSSIMVGPAGPPGVTYVYHGADPNVLRPDVDNPVTWVGSVEPLNSIDYDSWLRTP